ncbi:catabolic L-serine/threonine dehydratase [Lecanicillium sp. MT-2017a]|nr:catabolic L-serine/threonine dehydratase [Lecanicillium sp. MT-2017a]
MGDFFDRGQSAESDTKIPWIETPMVRSTTLSKTVGCNVYLKLENLQPSGSFKSRGIGNFLSSRLAQLRSSGVSKRTHFYSSSGGNAGLGCVHAAVVLGCEATVVVPMTTAEHMISKIREAGAANVIQKGASWMEADSYLTTTVMAEANARGENAVYVPPFDAPEIWDGNAGIVREIAKQLSLMSHHYPGPTFGKHDWPTAGMVDAIVCSVGGGGLFAGIMQGLDELEMHHTRVITAETLGADSLFQAVKKDGPSAKR